MWLVGLPSWRSQQSGADDFVTEFLVNNAVGDAVFVTPRSVTGRLPSLVADPLGFNEKLK